MSNNSMKVFSNNEAKSFIDQMLSEISKCSSVAELQDVPNKINFGGSLVKKMPKADKFPRLRLEISADEISELIKIGVIDENHRFSAMLADDQSGKTNKLTPLEKILYAILWKNGDLGKEQHIISAVLNPESNPKEQKSVVFYEFGKFLSKTNTYILDQHTVRCIAIGISTTEQEIQKARSIDLLNGSNADHKCYIDAYKNYCETISSRLNPGLRTDFMYHLDLLLFGAGKLMKLSKKLISREV